jgi:uncharacterized repeat protein (TIGR04076 family)
MACYYVRPDGPLNTESQMPRRDDTFTLYDLRVVVTGGDKPMVCNHKVGDYFELSGENLSLPAGQTFPIYPLAALLPILPARQRPTHANDWITTDTEVACPDPNCGARFRIVRVRERIFRHGEVTVVPLVVDARAEPRVSPSRARPRGGEPPPSGGRRRARTPRRSRR